MNIHTTNALGHPLVQGSRDWWALRLGIPTASSLSRIITAKRLQYAAGAQTYLAELVAERLLGAPLDAEVETIWTERGKELEDEARRWYEFHRGVDVQQIGFVTTDAGDFGGSPDGLVGEDGALEIKCRSAGQHMASVLGARDIADRLQTQGYLWLTGREWIDVLAYNPDLPKRVERHYRDVDVLAAISKYLPKFIADLNAEIGRLETTGDVLELEVA